MKFLKTISKTIAKTSPLGLLLAGTAVAMAAPTLKHTVRGTAVTMTRGVMNMSAAGAAIGHEMRESWEDIVAKAKSQKPTDVMPQVEKGTILGAGTGGAVGAGLGGNIGGGMGAAVGGGIGSVVGAGIGSSISEHSHSMETKNSKDNKYHKDIKEKTNVEETQETKNPKEYT